MTINIAVTDMQYKCLNASDLLKKNTKINIASEPVLTGSNDSSNCSVIYL